MSSLIINPYAFAAASDTGQIAQLSGSSASNTYTAASEFYDIPTDVWSAAFNIASGARGRAGSAGNPTHCYLLGGQDGSGYFDEIDRVAWADETQNTTTMSGNRAWGNTVSNGISVCVGQSYYYVSYLNGINEFTYSAMTETTQGSTSAPHPFGGNFGNSTYGFAVNGNTTGLNRYTYSDKSNTGSGFTNSPTSSYTNGQSGNSTTGLSVNTTAGAGNTRGDGYNYSSDSWTTGSFTSTTTYETGMQAGSTADNLYTTQTNTSVARSCEKYNYNDGTLSAFTSVATELDGGDAGAGASSNNVGVSS